MMEASFNDPSGQNTFTIVSDNTTVTSLISSIVANCTADLSSSANSTTAAAYNASGPNAPNPAEVVQYYRASSVALLLGGYNNSAVFNSSANATDSPLPSTVNTTSLDCLNQTIGQAAPLIGAASSIFRRSDHQLHVFSFFLAIFLSAFI